MSGLKILLDYTKRIKDKDLRDKTIKLLKNPSISNKSMKYPKSKYEEVPSWVGAHHNYTGGLLDHTVSVVETSIRLAEVYERIYKIKINYDYLISGALLHDIAKVFMISKQGKQWVMNNSKLDHAHFSAAELYARGFPEDVIHIVDAHGGELGQQAAYPRTIEALIVLHTDVLDSTVESMIHEELELLKQLQFLLVPQEGKKKKLKK